MHCELCAFFFIQPAIDSAVADRHSKFLLFWGHLCFLISMYNIKAYQTSRLGEQFAGAICPCYHRLPCWGTAAL